MKDVLVITRFNYQNDIYSQGQDQAHIKQVYILRILFDSDEMDFKRAKRTFILVGASDTLHRLLPPASAESRRIKRNSCSNHHKYSHDSSMCSSFFQLLIISSIGMSSVHIAGFTQENYFNGILIHFNGFCLATTQEA